MGVLVRYSSIVREAFAPRGKRPPVRTGQFSLMRFFERIVCAVITGLIFAAFNRC